MIILKDDFKIFTDSIDETTLNQLQQLAFSSPYSDNKIRIMPDCHAGKGCVIGTTIVLKDKVTPNLVGVDIGCGVYTVKFKKQSINFSNLDKFIKENIPHGDKINSHIIDFDFSNLKLKVPEKILLRAYKSIGTLGGGNHFIEIDFDDEFYYLLVHSGSRYIGYYVAKEYQEYAIEYIKNYNLKLREEFIEYCKQNNKASEIQEKIKKLPYIKIDKDLCYLDDTMFENYIHDMKILQKYALMNRKTMINKILDFLEPDIIEEFDTAHNYIDTEKMILRKGAVSAYKGQKVVIPLNMRDGSFICIGKGNEDWNYSAPHGAGRIMSRSEAKNNIRLQDFKESMIDIFTTCVSEDTLDESPFAYKNPFSIKKYITDTVDIISLARPVYNFKSNK